jgi:exosortase
MTSPAEASARVHSLVWTHWGPLVAVVALVAGAYWEVWAGLAETWFSNPQYSHGVFVPPFALFLLWHRRAISPAPLLSGSVWGWAFLLLAAGMRIVGARYYVGTLEQYSLFPALVGAVVCVSGWRGLRWAAPSIGYLLFMVPLHGRVSGLLSDPLQKLATVSSTFLLQAVGIPADRDGTVIHLTDVDVGVVEACNGLRMLVTFFAITTALAVIVRRPLWQKALIAVSAVPIAVACNVIRIAGTCVLHETVGHELADKVFHDLAGWLMMPMALTFLWAGVAVFDRVLVPMTQPVAKS